MAAMSHPGTIFPGAALLQTLFFLNLSEDIERGVSPRNGMCDGLLICDNRLSQTLREKYDPIPKLRPLRSRNMPNG